MKLMGVLDQREGLCTYELSYIPSSTLFCIMNIHAAKLFYVYGKVHVREYRNCMVGEVFLALSDSCDVFVSWKY